MSINELETLHEEKIDAFNRSVQHGDFTLAAEQMADARQINAEIMDRLLGENLETSELEVYSFEEK